MIDLNQSFATMRTQVRLKTQSASLVTYLETFVVYQSEVQYTKLDQEPAVSRKSISIRPLRTVFNTLPTYLRKSKGFALKKAAKNKMDNKSRKGKSQ